VCVFFSKISLLYRYQ